MAISLLAGAQPIFLSKPWVNRDADLAGQIVASSMQTLVHRLYQLDPLAPWAGSLGGSTETITIGIYSGSMQAAVSLDSFAILNNNLDAFLLEYCTDYTPGAAGAPGTGTWQTVTGGNVTGNAGADWRLFMASKIDNINGLRLTMTTTSPGGANKQVGNFIAALSTFQPTRPASKLVPSPVQTEKQVVLGDGTPAYGYFLWSDNSYVLTPWDAMFEHVSDADKTAYFDSLLTTDPFLVYLRPGDVARSVMLAKVKAGSYKPDLMNNMIGNGWKIPFTLQPLGYL
jgi:hypothetical protein